MQNYSPVNSPDPSSLLKYEISDGSSDSGTVSSPKCYGCGNKATPQFIPFRSESSVISNNNYYAKEYDASVF